MKKPSMKLLMQIGMAAFLFASIGGAIAIYADLQGYMQWAKVGFIIVVLGVGTGGLVVFSGIVMFSATAIYGGIESIRLFRTRGLAATIEEAKRRFRAEHDSRNS